MKAVKFILAIAILFITAMYYNVVSFNRGILQEFDDDEITLKHPIEKVESVKLGDDYYVFFLTDNGAYYEDLDADEYKLLDAFTDIKEKSIVPGLVGVGAAVLVLIFVGRKKK